MPPKGKASKADGGGAAAAAARKPFSVADMPYLPTGVLPASVELARTRIICGPDSNSNVRLLLPLHAASRRPGAARVRARLLPLPACSPRLRPQTEDFMNANSFMASGVDNAFTLDEFKQRFSIEVTSLGASARLRRSRRRAAPSHPPPLPRQTSTRCRSR